MSNSPKRWIEGAAVYQIYPRSFKDSNGDGIGDLPGVVEKLDYLKDLGIDAIWLSPFYRSPMADFGYDVADYRDVDPIFGTIEDFKELINQANARDIKIMVDLVMNHTSDHHEWFKQSRKSKDNKYSDWYIWSDPKEFNDGMPLAPNNWIEVFSGGSAWQWDEARQQFYLHSFNLHQPDLNWDNRDVREAIKDVMRYWLDLGVDGFRADAVSFISKDRSLADDPPNPNFDDNKDSKYARLIHSHSRKGPNLFNYLSEAAGVLKEQKYKNRHPFMVLEVYPSDHDHTQESLLFYQGVDPQVAAPFNFEGLALPWQAETWKNFLKEFQYKLSNLDSKCVANYAISNHDNPRLVTRLGEGRARAAAVLLLTLPGTVYIYNGDEIGMKDGTIPPEYISDPAATGGYGRDPARVPLQWSDQKNAGFSDGNKTWLPVNKDYKKLNVESESSDPDSFLSLYKKLLQLRQNSSPVKTGKFSVIDNSNDKILAFTRRSGKESINVFINMTDEVVTTIPSRKTGELFLSTYPRTVLDIRSKKLIFQPNEAAVFKN